MDADSLQTQAPSEGPGEIPHGSSNGSAPISSQSSSQPGDHDRERRIVEANPVFEESSAPPPAVIVTKCTSIAPALRNLCGRRNLPGPPDRHSYEKGLGTAREPRRIT